MCELQYSSLSMAKYLLPFALYLTRILLIHNRHAHIYPIIRWTWTQTMQRICSTIRIYIVIWKLSAANERRWVRARVDYFTTRIIQFLYGEVIRLSCFIPMAMPQVYASTRSHCFSWGISNAKLSFSKFVLSRLPKRGTRIPYVFIT